MGRPTKRIGRIHKGYERRQAAKKKSVGRPHKVNMTRVNRERNHLLFTLSARKPEHPKALLGKLYVRFLGQVLVVTWARVPHITSKLCHNSHAVCIGTASFSENSVISIAVLARQVCHIGLLLAHFPIVLLL